MTAIERTAYPKLLKGRYRKTDLRFYQPTIEEIHYMAAQNIRTATHRLNFMLQLKTFQQLHYFMLLEKIPASITHHVCQALDLPLTLKPHYHHSATTARHRALIREYCHIKTDKAQRQSTIETVTFEAAQTLNDPAEIINVVLDSLTAEQYEFPAFATLNKIVCHIRTKVNADIFKQITERLRNARKLTLLSETLTKNNITGKSPYHFFKALPQKPTVTHFKELLQRHDSLMTYGEMKPYLKDISEIKLAQFSEEARALDAPHLKAMNDKNKRYALLACLLAQAQRMAKDAAGKTCTISIHYSEKKAKQKYTGNQQKRDQLMVDVVRFVLDVTTGYENKKVRQKKIIEHLKSSYKDYGGTDKVIEDCEKLLAKPSSKHFAYLWKPYKSNRKNIFGFLNATTIKSIEKKKPLLEAVSLCKFFYKHKVQETWITSSKVLDTSFIPKIWKPLVLSKDKRQIHVRYFELCVMLQLCEEFNNGDVFIEGATEYGNYREAMMSAYACRPFIKDFCEAAKIPRNGKKAVKEMREKLTNTIQRINRDYPKQTSFVIDSDGRPSLKKTKSKPNPYAHKILKEIKKRMPERNLLDTLCLSHSSAGWAHCLSPLSGSDAKLVLRQ